MKHKRILSLLVVMAALLLTGCSMRTVDQMYCLPKRSDDHKNLQIAIENAMAGLDYCAPLSGENQQTVHSADLDGDGTDEYLLYAKSNGEHPLKIMVFDEVDDTFVLTATMDNNGTGFDLVEYVPMDNRPGVEVVVGCLFGDQPLRSVSVYTYAKGTADRLLTTSYTKFMTVDLNGNNLSELFVIHPGSTETENGVAELYSMRSGAAERSNEVNMSASADKLKRIVSSKLYDGEPAVYSACTVNETALITDAFILQDGILVNVAAAKDSDTGVKTLRNYYVYADDIDNDGTVELPYLIQMAPMQGQSLSDTHELIRWYGLRADGSQVDKAYTYHNFMGGWYVELDQSWAQQLTVLQNGNSYEFHVWTKDNLSCEQLFTVYVLTNQERDGSAIADDRFLLLKTESATYCATIGQAAEKYDITQQSITRSFRLIVRDWNTGET